MWLYVSSVQHVVSLLFASLFYFLITRLIVLILFLCLFSRFVCLFSISCILCFFVLLSVMFLLMDSDVSLLFLYKFTDHCRRAVSQLQ